MKMPVSFVIWLGVLATFIIVPNILAALRSRKLKSWAATNGFTARGKSLPNSISLDDTDLQNASSAWNVYEGESHGVRIIFFDCRIGFGKNSWRRTVIAALASRDVFESILSDTSVTVDHCGSWQILYEPKGYSFKLMSLMPVEEIAARIDAVYP